MADMAIYKPGLWPASSASARKLRQERGLSLIIVMLILIVVSLLGIAGVRIAMMAERGTRNDRDLQIAWQAAEAALVDAEMDIEGQPASSTNKRNAVFKQGDVDLSQFVSGCGSTGTSIGLCSLNPKEEKPAWLAVNFEKTGTDARTVEFGKFTGRNFPAGATGIQPVKPPRYVIEPIPDEESTMIDTPAKKKFLYRITAMGFGPKGDTQVVLQMIYRN
ncbi:pilus assembly PilX family protein [Verminephrobacter aporrectodeae]|uniref:pilus assembly PilX family protein n=1 Tax=Verminephrobacter aporrectodeae TaxID=1110389 RepID=UPI002243F741|nr:PilX N-terminal domain-containing pilus assembly protein [Verminephrobacter aporrectodeae]